MGEYQGDAGFESAALQELIAFIGEPRDVVSSFEEFETMLHEKICTFEREQVAKELTRYDPGEKRIEVGGVKYRRKLDCEHPYLSQAGEVSVYRTLYVPCHGTGRAICPMELGSGIVGGYWTPRAARIAAVGVGQMTPKECSLLFAEQGGMQPSTSSLDCTTRRFDFLPNASKLTLVHLQDRCDLGKAEHTRGLDLRHLSDPLLGLRAVATIALGLGASAPKPSVEIGELLHRRLPASAWRRRSLRSLRAGPLPGQEFHDDSQQPHRDPIPELVPAAPGDLARALELNPYHLPTWQLQKQSSQGAGQTARPQ